MKRNMTQFLAALAVSLAAFTSCNTDAEGTIYDVVGPEVAFVSTQMNVELTTDDKGIIKVPVYRGNVSGDASVAITIDANTVEQGLFSLKNPNVAFKSGEAVAYAELGFNSLDDLGATEKYEMVLAITDKEQLSPTALQKITVTAQRKLTWEVYGTGVYTSGLFDDSWAQPIEKAKEGNIYRLPDCISEGFPMVFALSDNGQSLLTWDPQQTGYKHPTYGMVSFSPTGMTRNGNVLTFSMRGLVVVNGQFGVLYQGFSEILEMPER